MRLDKFRIVRNDKQESRPDLPEEIKFSSIKVLKNDNVLVTEPGSNDLVVYNTKFEEVRRVPGIKGDCFGRRDLTRQRGHPVLGDLQRRGHQFRVVQRREPSLDRGH